ncbi:type II secretion system protein [Escherichia coli]|uniref:type II secretion system protein n=1 Tax=Escherichia coli TaxID=562 RepID=UPI001F35AE88|nr:type II secretion system protein [Escherichia coli]MCF7447200.1 type II secretion system GspH family protein [Escherichia coli]MEC9995346.1 type II secretion system protein [Escherichia coli]
MRKESGLSLIESAVVLSLAAAVTAGVLYYYNSANQSKLVDDTVAQIQSIVSQLNAMFTSNPSAMPQGSNNTDERNKVMEAVSELTGISLMEYSGGGKVLKNPMGYGIQFWGTGFRKYQIETQVKDVDTCTRLAVLDLGTVSYQGVQVYQGNAEQGTVSSVQNASQYCSQVNYNDNSNPVKVRFSIKF